MVSPGCWRICFSWIFKFSLLISVLAFPKCPLTGSPPTATVKNGTLRGQNLPEFSEDLFLGIPFAQPPLGDLRFRHPASIVNAWRGERDATVRSPSCPGYAGFDAGLTLGEGKSSFIRCKLRSNDWLMAR